MGKEDIETDPEQDEEESLYEGSKTDNNAGTIHQMTITIPDSNIYDDDSSTRQSLPKRKPSLEAACNFEETILKGGQ